MDEPVGRPIGVEIAIEIVFLFLCESVAYSQGTRRNDPDFDSDFDPPKNSTRSNFYRDSRQKCKLPLLERFRI